MNPPEPAADPATHQTLPAQRKLVCLAFGLVAAGLIVLVYWPGLNGGFLFDDIPNITAHPGIQIDGIDRETLARAWSAYGDGLFLGRPLAAVSFGIDHARAGGMYAWYFKQTSLIIHLLNTLLIFLLARQLLRLDARFAASPLHATAGRGNANWPAWVALALAVAWAVHPLQVSTVLYVVQRMEMLAVTFTLLSLTTYCLARQHQIAGRAGGWPLLGAAGILAALGLLAKETAVLTPLFTLCLELALYRFRAKAAGTSTALKWLYAIGVLAGLVWFMFGIAPRFMAPEAYQYRPFDLRERLLTQLRVLPMYLSFMLYPAPDRMLFFYDAYPVSRGWLQPATTLAGTLVLAGMAAIAVVLRNKLPLLTLGILWFFAAHLLTSNIISLELAFEHRNYFALFPILIAAAVIMRSLASERIRIPPAALSSAAILLLAVLTLIRSATWGDPMNLALHHANISPQSERARLEVGYQFASLSGGSPESPLYSIAIHNLESASELPGSSPMPEQMLILLAATGGTEAREQWWDRFLDKLRTGPLDAQTRTAITSLLSASRESLPIDDLRLYESFLVLKGREETRPETMLHYLLYVIENPTSGLTDEIVLGALSRRLDQDEDEAERLASILVRQGHHSQAVKLLHTARESDQSAASSTTAE